MHISKLTLQNHYSFLEESRFQFSRGFNVIVGANSSGKSTVLKSIVQATEPSPHKSVLSIPDPGVRTSKQSTISLSYSLELRDIFRLNTNRQVRISHGKNENPNDIINSSSVTSALDRIFELNTIRDHPSKVNLRLSAPESNGPWVVRNSDIIPVLTINPDTPNQFTRENLGPFDEWNRLRSALTKSTYYFSNESRAPTDGLWAQSIELSSTCDNLPFCLNHLQTYEQETHRELVELTRRIVPSVRMVNARVLVPGDGPNQTFQIVVNAHEAETRRSDLAVPLNKVGTGVGSIISMMYVLVTAKTSKILILEEPNSFLHPRALRELLAILGEIGSKHQFFISTHSSELLRVVDVATVTHLTLKNHVSEPHQVPRHQLGKLASGLLEMGIRLTDLHGCAYVIWVEGQTEEEVYPKVLRKYFSNVASDIAVLCVFDTGGFEGKKDIARIVGIYETLSTGNTLAPIMICVLLDQEGRKVEEREKLTRDSGGKVQFIDQPMLENYFLSAEAIHHLLEQRGIAGVELDAVVKALARTMSRTDLVIGPKDSQSRPHAANVLGAVIAELSETRYEYRKAQDGPVLAEYILEHEPERFEELRVRFSKVLERLPTLP